MPVPIVDRLSEAVGRLAAALLLAMVVLAGANALLRWVGSIAGARLTSNALVEGQWYLFAAVFLLGAPWALLRDAHVRVDILSVRLSAPTRARIDIAGTLLFLLPFCALAVWTSFGPVAASWRILEGSPDPGGLPRYPIKTLVPVAFALLALQGLSEIVRRLPDLHGVSR